MPSFTGPIGYLMHRATQTHVGYKMISKIFPGLGDNPFRTETEPQKDAISSYLEDGINNNKPDSHRYLSYVGKERIRIAKCRCQSL